MPLWATAITITTTQTHPFATHAALDNPHNTEQLWNWLRRIPKAIKQDDDGNRNMHPTGTISLLPTYR